MNPRRFKELVGRRPRRSRPFNVAPKTASKPLPIEALDHYWHPEREGVEMAPADFQAKLHAISGILQVCRPPARAPLVYERAWLVWMKQPRVTHRLCPGWWLLFDWRQHFDDGRKPKAIATLDDRLLANLYMMQPRRWGGAVKYFDHCVEEMQRDKARKDKANTDHSHDVQDDFHKSMTISTAGSGSKFARHHDGTILPSRGAHAWHQERRKHLIPKEVRLDEERQADERADARRGRPL